MLPELIKVYPVRAGLLCPDGIHNGHVPEPPPGAVYSQSHGKQHNQDNCSKLCPGHRPGIAPVDGDQGGEQETVEEQSQHGAQESSGCRVCGSLGRQHPKELAGAQADGPECAVLAGSGRGAHGDAVDYIEDRNQSDKYEKAADKEPEAVPGALGAGIADALVGKGILRAHKLMDSVYIGIGSVRGQLQIDDGIAVFSCELTEGIFGADDNGSACGSGERAGGKCAGNLKRRRTCRDPERLKFPSDDASYLNSLSLSIKSK